MSIWELVLLGVALAMDAFAVSICKGVQYKKFNVAHALIIALTFGVFQGGMALIGFFAGSLLLTYIEPIDHWIAFGLLLIVGSKMIIDAIKEDDKCDIHQTQKLNIPELLVLAIATSIDALVVGFSLAMVSTYIVESASIIALVTFIISFAGCYIGHVFGSRFEKISNILGGAVLILIGVKTLIEHLIG